MGILSDVDISFRPKEFEQYTYCAMDRSTCPENGFAVFFHRYFIFCGDICCIFVVYLDFYDGAARVSERGQLAEDRAVIKIILNVNTTNVTNK